MTEESNSGVDESALGILTNTQRLRTYLAGNSLAAALLTAWEKGDPAQAKARMLAAVNNFHSPKQIADDQISDYQN